MMILSVFFQPKVKKIFLTSIYNLNLKKRSHFAIILYRKDNRIPSIFILYYKIGQKLYKYKYKICVHQLNSSFIYPILSL